MTDYTLSQPNLRARNIARSIALRQALYAAAVVAVACFAGNVIDDLRRPTFHRGDFNSDFSEDFDIDRWECKLPLGFEIDVTARSAYIQHRRLAFGLTILRW